ncbi:hypothetical protein ElyMa_005325400 [Elysia marginata]|uniref:Uncharacterized protein n=1 Tax=Elysia marginata TaxID=1093978 RepID=A0AAV4K155_9GAST|nr:hypothetical protein ElyMa_005325400 [Elysia marginata]
MTCRRLKIGDDLCERTLCQKYSVQLNATQCSFHCGMLLWAIGYDLQILYFKFGEIPEPVKDGTCVEPIEVDSTNITSTGPTTKNNTVHNRSISYTNSSNTNSTDFGPNRGLENSKSSSSSTPVLAGSVGGGVFFVVLIIALGVTIYFKRAKTGSRESNVSGTYTDSSTATTGSSSSTELNKSDLFQREIKASSKGDTEEQIYHTLNENELSDNIGHNNNFDECDEQGYHVIQDCKTKDHRSNHSGDEKMCRPLPSPPISSKRRLQSMSSERANTGQSRRFSDSSISTEPCSLDTGKQGPSLPAFPFSYRRLSNGAESTAFPQLPPSHRRVVDLEEHQHMGLVNLRHDGPMFGHVTEVKLVRTQPGHLELVSAHDESPAFTEYYTRLLLINQPGGSVGVVGLLDPDGSCSEDQCQSSQLLCGKREPPTQKPNHGETYGYGSYPGEHGSSSNYVSKQSLNIVYFGSLSLNEEQSMSPCDYLTPIDIDPSEISCGIHPRLTTGDHPARNTPTSHHRIILPGIHPRLITGLSCQEYTHVSSLVIILPGIHPRLITGIHPRLITGLSCQEYTHVSSLVITLPGIHPRLITGDHLARNTPTSHHWISSCQEYTHVSSRDYPARNTPTSYHW